MTQPIRSYSTSLYRLASSGVPHHSSIVPPQFTDPIVQKAIPARKSMYDTCYYDTCITILIQVLYNIL